MTSSTRRRTLTDGIPASARRNVGPAISPGSRSWRVAASRLAQESRSRSAIRAASFGSGASTGGWNNRPRGTF
jgi:hypothetical protein